MLQSEFQPVTGNNVLPLAPLLGVDRLLTDLRSGRRLEKVAASIESFLLSQVSKLNHSLDKCQQALDRHEVVRQIVADFELEKQQWATERQAEIDRLVAAGEDLMKGWQELEQERQAFEQRRNISSSLLPQSRVSSHRKS